MAKYYSYDSDTADEIFSEMKKFAEKPKEDAEKDLKKYIIGDTKKGEEILSLYDVDLGYKEDIIDMAHGSKDAKEDEKDSLPSYNNHAGRVENQKQQQEISLQVATNPSCGKLFPQTMANTKKEASQILADELVLLADEMDIYGEEQISNYADLILSGLKKEALKAEAAVPLAIPIVGGVAALAVIGWWLSSYSDKEDVKNKGIDSNIIYIENFIREYIAQIDLEMQEEVSGQIKYWLADLLRILTQIKNTRHSYMEYMQSLASTLRTITNIDPSQGAVSSDNVQQLAQSKEAQSVIKEMRSANAKYTKYITNLLPRLQQTLTDISEYFAQTKDIDNSINRSTWEDFKNIFTANNKRTSYSDKIVSILQSIINSLKLDVKLREVETNATIKAEIEKVQSNIGNTFTVPVPSNSNSASQQPVNSQQNSPPQFPPTK